MERHDGILAKIGVRKYEGAEPERSIRLSLLFFLLLVSLF